MTSKLIRNVTKQLLGAEDFIFNQGKQLQKRGQDEVQINSVDFAVSVTSESDLLTLDATRYLKAVLGYRKFIAVNGKYQETTDYETILYKEGAELTAEFPVCRDGDTVAKWTGAFPKILGAEDKDLIGPNWQIIVNALAPFISESEPDTRIPGARWYKPSEATTYIYYVDGNSAQWVEESVANAVSGDEASGNLLTLRHKRKEKLVLPLHPPLYNEIRSQYGYSYIYPQGFCVDEVANELFIIYSNSGGNNTWAWVWVFDWNTGEYKTVFSAGDVTGEGLAVDYQNNSRFLYARTTANPSIGNIGKFDITSLPSASTTTRLTPIEVLPVSLHFQFSLDGDYLWVDTNRTPFGTLARRTEFVKYNKFTYQPEGAARLPQDSSGGLTTEPYGTTYFPKRQGTAFRNGLIVASYGAFFEDGSSNTPANYQGIRIFSADGQLRDSVLYKPVELLEKVKTLHPNASRLENEGVYISSNNYIYTLWIYTASSLYTSEEGVIIYKEFDASLDAEDYKESAGDVGLYVDNGKPYQLAKLYNSTYYSNPITGQDITNLSHVSELMYGLNLREVLFDTSHAPMNDWNDQALPSSRFVRVYNPRNSVMYAYVQGSAGMTLLRYTGGSSGTQSDISGLYDKRIRGLQGLDVFAENGANFGIDIRRSNSNGRMLRLNRDNTIPSSFFFSTLVTGSDSYDTWLATAKGQSGVPSVVLGYCNLLSQPTLTKTLIGEGSIIDNITSAEIAALELVVGSDVSISIPSLSVNIVSSVSFIASSNNGLGGRSIILNDEVFNGAFNATGTVKNLNSGDVNITPELSANRVPMFVAEELSGGTYTFRPSGALANTKNLGDPRTNMRWTEIFATNGTINTSDAREKTVVSAMTADEINAAKQLAQEIGTYKFLSAIAEKGDAARTHIGMTVQRAIEIMEANNLVATDYSFICHDSWDEQPAESEKDPVTGEMVEYLPAKPAGDIYSFRYDELNMFIARGFEARLSALEEQLNNG